jgi:uncharacterized protein YndB with AHSA1/START domain
MTMQATQEAVRREITVQASPERAFAVFTDRFDSWWPRGHHIGEAEMSEAILEPRLGGRWYERGVDGSECVWGEVLAWAPPHRLLLSWHIGGDWKLDPDPAHASEIEISFTPVGDATRVDVEHRHFERHGATAEALREGVGGEDGWNGLLEAYRSVAESSESADELMQ